MLLNLLKHFLNELKLKSTQVKIVLGEFNLNHVEKLNERSISSSDEILSIHIQTVSRFFFCFILFIHFWKFSSGQFKRSQVNQVNEHATILNIFLYYRHTHSHIYGTITSVYEAYPFPFLISNLLCCNE